VEFQILGATGGCEDHWARRFERRSFEDEVGIEKMSIYTGVKLKSTNFEEKKNMERLNLKLDSNWPPFVNGLS
jgi:hypothetical protein